MNLNKYIPSLKLRLEHIYLSFIHRIIQGMLDVMYVMYVQKLIHTLLMKSNFNNKNEKLYSTLQNCLKINYKKS